MRKLTIEVEEIVFHEKRPVIVDGWKLPADWLVWCNEIGYHIEADCIDESDDSSLPMMWENGAYVFAATRPDNFHNLSHGCKLVKYQEPVRARAWHIIGNRPERTPAGFEIEPDWPIWAHHVRAAPYSSDDAKFMWCSDMSGVYFAVTLPDDRELIARNINAGFSVVQYHPIGYFTVWAEEKYGLVDDIALALKLWADEYIASLPQWVDL